MIRYLAVCSSVLALTLVSACAPAPPPEPDTSAMVAAADELDQRFLAAFNAGDAAAMAVMYGPEAVSFPPDAMTLRGAEIATGMASMLEPMQAAGARISVVESHQIPAGDVVIGWGLLTLTMNGPDGSPIEMQMRYTDAKAKRDGRWVYILDHASAPMPPSPPAM